MKETKRKDKSIMYTHREKKRKDKCYIHTLYSLGERTTGNNSEKKKHKKIKKKRIEQTISYTDDEYYHM